uniref:Pre-mRNA-splicing factor Syf1-like N-terminal HAT-repeats domain-containing protein n=1 Tax=Serinus canaria TaxID=9135 RepID=A0A8C9L5Z6_SERCA
MSPEEEEVQHEEELLRNPFSVRGWLRYAQARQRGPRPRLNQIYERALRELPRQVRAPGHTWGGLGGTWGAPGHDLGGSGGHRG